MLLLPPDIAVNTHLVKEGQKKGTRDVYLALFIVTRMQNLNGQQSSSTESTGCTYSVCTYTFVRTSNNSPCPSGNTDLVDLFIVGMSIVASHYQ